MLLRNKIILSVTIFLVAYFFFLVIWLNIKPYYGSVQAHLGSHLSALTTGFQVKDIRPEKEVATITFSRPILTAKGLADFVVDIKIAVSNYSFNVPLTFALVAGLFPFFNWRKRFFFEAVLILIFIHMLYIYSLCNLKLVYQFSAVKKSPPSAAIQYILEFIWAFTDNMVIRFEPFLIAVYLWLRNRGQARS